ncbi:MAG: hypothetical protein QNJ16_21870 [Rhodobacter sp.]|nr:hypothetical protein [Rhodobacter sp.]
MAKIGKFSTGLKGAAKEAGSPYGQSNKGYEARSNEMGVYNSIENRQKPAPTSAGAAPSLTLKKK